MTWVTSQKPVDIENYPCIVCLKHFEVDEKFVSVAVGYYKSLSGYPQYFADMIHYHKECFLPIAGEEYIKFIERNGEWMV